MARIAFVLEQALGHATHAKNLMGNLAGRAEVDPAFLPIPYRAEGWAARLPLVRSNWSVRAGLLARQALSREARRAPFDGLFVHTQVPGVLAADWVRRIPSVVSLDATPLQYDALGEVYSHARGPEWLERAKYRLNRRLFAAADRLLAWTEWTRRSLIEDYGCSPDRVAVIPPGVNPEDWARPGPPRARPEGDSPVRILFVGGDLERKGGRLLLDAFRALSTREGPPLELHLVTRTPMPAEPGVHIYNDLTPNDGRLVRLYHQAVLFCLPAFGDCLPMVLSEAGAAGLPVLSTRVAGIPEIVAEGESGLLVEPHDAAALTRALARLVEDPDLRLRLGRRGAEIVRQRFDAVRNAGRLVALLLDVVARGKEGRGG